jgi:hypothetical protein
VLGHPSSNLKTRENNLLQSHPFDLLNDWLAGRPELKRTFALWIRALLLRRSKNTLVLPKVRDLTELKMTLAEKFDQWEENYKRQGHLEGMTLALQRLLTRRFGPLPTEVITRFATATVEDMENWADRLLEAQSLDEVFRPS